LAWLRDDDTWSYCCFTNELNPMQGCAATVALFSTLELELLLLTLVALLCMLARRLASTCCHAYAQLLANVSGALSLRLTTFFLMYACRRLASI
jgi:hypothetical protein